MCMRLQRSMHGEQVAGARAGHCSPAALLHRPGLQGCVIEDSLLMGADYYEQYEECEAFTVSPVWLLRQLPFTCLKPQSAPGLGGRPCRLPLTMSPGSAGHAHALLPCGTLLAN